MSFVWINGQLVDKSEAKISVFDHGFLYGDGVWEHFRAFGGKLFRPEKDLSRFFDTLHRILVIDPAPTPDEIVSGISVTMQANRRNDAYVRVMITRGVGTLGPDPRKLDYQVIIIAEEYQPFPSALYERGLSLGMAQLIPWKPARWWNGFGQLELVQAKQAALQQGSLDAVMVSGTEVVRAGEGSLWLVSGNRFRCTLSGITEGMFDAISEIATTLGLELDWLEPFSFEQMFAADEVFLAGITCGVIAVLKVQNKPIGTGTEGPVTKRIREAYRKMTRGEA